MVFNVLELIDAFVEGDDLGLTGALQGLILKDGVQDDLPNEKIRGQS